MGKKNAVTWGDLINCANEHAAEMDCEVRLVDPARASSLIQVNAPRVEVALYSSPLDDGSDLLEASRAYLTQVAVVDGVAILRAEDPDTGSVQLIGSTGVNLFRHLYV